MHGKFYVQYAHSFEKKMHYLKKTCTCILNLYYLPNYLKKIYFFIEKKNKITTTKKKKKKKKKKRDFKNSNYNISFKKILRFSIDD